MSEYFRETGHKVYLPLLVLCAWTAFGLFFGAQNYFRDIYFGKNASLGGYLVGWILCGYSWGILTTPIIWFARRSSFARLGWLWFFPVHGVAAAIFSLLQLGIYDVFAHALFGGGGHGFFEYYGFLIANEFQSSFLVYFALIACIFAYDHFTRNLPDRSSLEMIENSQGTPEIDFNSAAFATKGTDGYENGTAPLRRISIKENGRIVLLDVNEIDWIKSEGNYVSLHTANKKYLVRETMNAMEKKLDPSEFVRLRRSTIARIAEIKEFHPMFNGEYEVILKAGTTLSSSRRYRKNLESILKA